MAFKNVAESKRTGLSDSFFVAHLIRSFSQIPMKITPSENHPIQHEQIAARSRELWQKAGSPDGRDLEFWLGAEAELGRDRQDVQQTQRGEIESPARSTPGGNEKTGRTFPKDESAEKPAKKTRRVSAPAR
jgi:hypothetical protein